ncbi:alpha/beta fold hydrolase [Flavobacterium sp.]|uniref:alpha/beta fold hydrolase n=1 Tax=Flavobacterium sp. TaxID=239 RepID=UPI003D0AC593
MHLNKLVLFFLLFKFSLVAQTNYGSNNGTYTTLLDTKIYYETYGEGTPILLLHGGFGSIRDFEKVIPILSQNHKVIIPDAPGLGRSAYASKPLDYALLAEFSEKFIEILNLKEINVIGWSDGAITALILAQNKPELVKNLIIVGANYKSEGFKNIEEVKKWSNPEWIAKNWPRWVANYQKIDPNKDWKRYVVETKNYWFQKQYFPQSHLKKLKAKTLVVYGDQDLYTIEHGLEIHKAIKNSQFCVLPNCSHEVFEEKPELISQLTIDFINNK